LLKENGKFNYINRKREEKMPEIKATPQLRLVHETDIKDKVVLIRVDHNVVKKGEIKDSSRIEASLGTLFNIISRGGRPILMTHIGRPRDKKTGKINCLPDRSIDPVVAYLEKRLRIKIEIPAFTIHPEIGISTIDSSIQKSIQRLREHKIGAIYLPNVRWFQGEETDGPARTRFARQLANLAGIFVNDAFGSWQPHVSTFDITKFLPSYAGFLLEEEIKNLEKVLNPARPLLAIVAGAKYDTKIGPLKELYQRVDHLILGGIMYNTFLCAKYGVDIAGVPEEDIDLASELVRLDKEKNKIVELPLLVESEDLGERKEGKTKTIAVKNFRKGDRYNYILDADPDSFHEKPILDIINSAKTILVNAVMGVIPHFWGGSKSLYKAVDGNSSALKLYGGGDTLQELKNLCPGVYLKGLDNPDCYYFTGGGTVLKALEEGSPFKIKPVERLLKK
jgi:phosphoglycerate kinase